MMFSLATVGNFALGLLKNPYVILGGALALFVFLWWMRGNTIDRLEADLAQAHNYNVELNETLKRQQVDNAQQLAIISDLEDELTDVNNAISEQLGKVRSVPDSDDGTLAPVSRDTLEWLREHEVRDGQD